MAEEKSGVKDYQTVTKEEYDQLFEGTKNQDGGKAYLDSENKKMADWIKKLESDKEELIKDRQLFTQKINELQSYVKELLEKSNDNQKKIADMENEKSKLNYQINKYLSNPKIKKIVETEKLDQF